MIATRSRQGRQGPARLRRPRRRGEEPGARAQRADRRSTSRSAASPPRASRSPRRRSRCSSRSTSRSAAGSSAPCARSSASTKRASRCRRAMPRPGRALAEPVTRAWWAPGRVRALAELRVAIADALEGHGEKALDRVRHARAKLSPRLIQHQFSYYTEINLLIALGRTKEARNLLESRGPIPTGEVLKLSHWIAQMHLWVAENAPKPVDRAVHDPRQAAARDRRQRAPRPDAQGPVDDRRRRSADALRVVLRAPRRARRRAVLRIARRRIARARIASTSRCPSSPQWIEEYRKEHPDLDHARRRRRAALYTARDRTPVSRRGFVAGEHAIEHAALVESANIREAADGVTVDEDLRNRRAARRLDEPAPLSRDCRSTSMCSNARPSAQQAQGGRAVATPLAGVDLYVRGHVDVAYVLRKATYERLASSSEELLLFGVFGQVREDHFVEALLGDQALTEATASLPRALCACAGSSESAAASPAHRRSPPAASSRRPSSARRCAFEIGAVTCGPRPRGSPGRPPCQSPAGPPRPAAAAAHAPVR